MLNKKIIFTSLILMTIGKAYAAASTPQAATPAPATAAAPATKAQPAAPTLILEISAPDALANLAKGYQPNPVYLQYTPNDGNPPIYSEPLIPGQDKPIELKITSASKNGAQFQIVSSMTGDIQPMSFMYAFTEDRLVCLITKNAKVMVNYNINNRMMEVEGLPVDC